MSNTPHKKVLFLINSLTVGGAERVFVNDANVLHEHGWDVHVATLFSNGQLARDLSVPADHLHALNAKSFLDMRAMRTLRALCKKNGIRTLYTTLNESNAFGRFAVLGTDVALMTREANMADIKPPKYKLLDMLVGWRSKRIIAVSEAVKRSVVGYAPWLQERTVVLYNGVEVPPVPPSLAPVEGGIKLLCVASLTKKKDQAVLLRALALLPKDFSLTLVGEGGERAHLEALSAELGVSDRVQFAGILGNAALIAVYRSHHVFVLPSKREGCPNVVSEAQRFALPVVAFDIPGMSEFVSDESGIRVIKRTPETLAAAIQKAADPAQARAFGEAGFAEVGRTRSMKNHVQALESLLC
jgi:glycosyltransferase involved in cell wall biosynthesis